MTDDAGSTSVLPLDLFGAGDPRFVAALRGVADSAALAGFAAPWFADARPAARQLLFAYLDEPPNAPGHEGLIKRLFKLAEAAGDDAVMARFLVLGDRLIARTRRVVDRWVSESCATLEAARGQGLEWSNAGWSDVRWGPDPGTGAGDPRPYQATGRYGTTTGSPRHTTLPRPDWKGAAALAALTDDDRASRRWFSVATRRYLQRRAWRYFQNLGQTDPARYVATAEIALGLYRNEELGDGFALLDHFGLMHLLFDQSPALVLGSAGWDLAPGQTLAGLTPDPAFEEAWIDHPEAVVRVLARARAAVVARWAVRRVEAEPERFSRIETAAGWANLLDQSDPEVVALALAMLGGIEVDQVRREIPPRRWVEIAAATSSGNQATVCDLIRRVVRPDEVSRADAVRLALSSEEALARLGWSWVEGQGVVAPPVGDDPERDARELLRLVDAGFEPLRPPILAAVRTGLAGRAEFRADWVWALLDSRHLDARVAGWAWFAATESCWDDPLLWARLVESPHPDIRARCAPVAGPVPVEPARWEPVWGAVLLAPHGVARIKPRVIRRVVARLEALPPDPVTEAAALIDLLAIVVRSARAPERRSALAALVALAERRPKWAGRIEGAVPALQLSEGPAILPASGSSIRS